MKPDFEPKVFKAYNLSPEEQIELDKFLKEHLDRGTIKPSNHPWPHLSSLSKRKTENCDPVKTTDT